MTPSLRRRARRIPLTVFVAASLLPACTGEPAARGPTLMEMARTLGSEVVTSLANGYYPGRSGEVILVPAPNNVLAQWRGGLRGANDPRTTHSTPWAYHQRVPIALYGPGYVREGRRVGRAVTVADLAPTMAELLGIRFDSAGSVLREALVPAAKRPDAPRAIVVLVVDGGGWNVLEQWPDAWRTQRRLMEEGTTYTNATVGAAPSVTAPVHATIGTGTFPAAHGIPENTCRRPDGTIGDITLDGGDLSLLRGRTLADVWDAENANRAWVGMLGFETWHLGMMGPGAAAPGGDADVAVLWDEPTDTFWTDERFYSLPRTLPPADVLDRRLRELDASDGSLDGTWRGNTLDRDSYTFTGNPAFAGYQGDAIMEMLRREPVGRDQVTDLLFVELKTGDVAGHIWNMVGRETEVVFRTQDGILRDMVELLDERIGRGRYVLAMTADHGQTMLPERSGGLRIDRFVLHEALNDEFDDAVEAVHPTDLFVSPDAEADLEAIARWIGDYRYGDGLPEGVDDGDVPRDLLDRRVFAAALPGEWLASLGPERIASLGPGRYAEGDLTSPPLLSAF